MEGYIIINAQGKRLTHRKFWLDNIGGWVWSELEKDEILKESRDWQFKPAFVQKARLDVDIPYVVAIGSPIKVK